MAESTQSRVVDTMARAAQRGDTALTVAEIADEAGLTVSRTRTTLIALERRHEVHKAGASLSGARCWMLGEGES